MRLVTLVVVFIAFTVWTSSIAFGHGLLGFVSLAGREPWAAQMLADLFLSFFVAWSWLRHDAKERGIPSWPYIIGTLTLGSIGTLAYLIHRELVGRRTAVAG